jgi:hypothetical protein
MWIIGIAKSVSHIWLNTLEHIKKARKVLKGANQNLSIYGHSIYNFLVA